MRKPTQLDRELKAWGGRVNRDLPPADKHPPFPHSIRLDAKPRPAARPGRTPFFAPLGLAGLALAALLLFLWSGERPKDPPSVPVGTLESPDNEFFSQKPFFEEIARLFQGHSVWISGENAAMILEVEADPVSARRPDVVLRMEIERQSEEGSWQTVWRRDVLAHENQWTEAPRPGSVRESVSVWVHSLAENTWLVESHFVLPGLHDLEARKQITLSGGDSPEQASHTELGGGLRMVHRLMPLQAVEWKDNV